jgi:transposase
MASSSWQDVGRLTHRIVKGKDICASYRLQEESLELYGRNYRVAIVHSDAHDKRRQKRIAKAIGHDAAAWKKITEELGKKKFFCLPDAESAAQSLQNSAFHKVSYRIEQRPVYGRGRPRQGEARRVKAINYHVRVDMHEDKEAIEKLKEEAGCFVLLTNVPADEKVVQRS